MNNEYIKESEYLHKVLSLLNDEINVYIDKRKQISDIIVDYRKKFIEEYKDDDDKIIEYFDHENYKNEQIFNTVERRIKEFLKLKKSAYFGKIQICEDNEYENFYIGAYGFDIGEETPVIIDWRAPISSLFYEGKLGNLFYTLPSSEKVDILLTERKQFLIREDKIISMFDSEIDVKDDFLKEMLSLKASNKLKNIVQTIQSNQDKIIRLDRNKCVVINGVAGSGKTSVALHRVAYLLYNFRDYFFNRVLIISPNRIFMEYISSVLPSLGEYGGVLNLTSEDFIHLGIEDINFDSYVYQMEKIFDDKDYSEEFRFKGSLEVKQKIDSFLDYVEQNINLGSDVYFRDEVIVTSEEINKLFYEIFKSRALEIRVELIRKKIFDRIKRVRNKFVYEIVNKYEKMEYDEDLINHYDMLKKNEIYEVISESSEIKSSLHYLKFESPYELYKEFYEENFYKDLNSLDFADLILIKYIYLKCFNVRRIRDFKLVVLDEAQDFSYMFYEVLKMYTNSNSYVIVGDLNQSMINFHENFTTSTNIFENKIEISMKDSYRSTKKIVDYSKKYLKNQVDVNSIREGNDVSFVQCDFKDIKEIILNKVNEFNVNENYNIGILVKNKVDLYKLYEEIKGSLYVKIIDDEDNFYSDKGVFLTTSYFSKGLEFDAVIVVDNNIEDSILYIMLTRAMHEVVHIKTKM